MTIIFSLIAFIWLAISAQCVFFTAYCQKMSVEPYKKYSFLREMIFSEVIVKYLESNFYFKLIRLIGFLGFIISIFLFYVAFHPQILIK